MPPARSMKLWHQYNSQGLPKSQSIMEPVEYHPGKSKNNLATNHTPVSGLHYDAMHDEIVNKMRQDHTSGTSNQEGWKASLKRKTSRMTYGIRFICALCVATRR